MGFGGNVDEMCVWMIVEINFMDLCFGVYIVYGCIVVDDLEWFEVVVVEMIEGISVYDVVGLFMVVDVIDFCDMCVYLKKVLCLYVGVIGEYYLFIWFMMIY